MRPYTFYQSAADAIEYLEHGNRTQKQIASHLRCSIRKVEYIVTYLRRREMIRTLVNPTSYELILENVPATVASSGRPLAEPNLRPGIGSRKPYYRTYRQLHNQGSSRGGRDA